MEGGGELSPSPSRKRGRAGETEEEAETRAQFMALRQLTLVAVVCGVDDSVEDDDGDSREDWSVHSISLASELVKAEGKISRNSAQGQVRSPEAVDAMVADVAGSLKDRYQRTYFRFNRQCKGLDGLITAAMPDIRKVCAPYLASSAGKKRIRVRYLLGPNIEYPENRITRRGFMLPAAIRLGEQTMHHLSSEVPVLTRIAVVFAIPFVLVLIVVALFLAVVVDLPILFAFAPLFSREYVVGLNYELGRPGEDIWEQNADFRQTLLHNLATEMRTFESPAKASTEPPASERVPPVGTSQGGGELV